MKHLVAISLAVSLAGAGMTALGGTPVPETFQAAIKAAGLEMGLLSDFDKVRAEVGPDAWKEAAPFGVVPLRLPPPDSYPLLILGCGNHVEAEPDKDDEHAHPDALTVDRVASMNPTFVANFQSRGFLEYLKMKGYSFKKIHAENSNPLFLDALAMILEPGGVYDLDTSIYFTFYRSTQEAPDLDETGEFLQIPLGEKEFMDLVRLTKKVDKDEEVPEDLLGHVFQAITHAFQAKAGAHHFAVVEGPYGTAEDLEENLLKYAQDGGEMKFSFSSKTVTYLCTKGFKLRYSPPSSSSPSAMASPSSSLSSSPHPPSSSSSSSSSSSLSSLKSALVDAGFPGSHGSTSGDVHLGAGPEDWKEAAPWHVVPLRVPLPGSYAQLILGGVFKDLDTEVATRKEGALRVDPEVGMDPTWVAHSGNPRFFDYLHRKGYTFKEVLAEKGASRPGLGLVAQVLEPEGIYVIEAPVLFTFYRSSRITKAWSSTAEVPWLPLSDPDFESLGRAVAGIAREGESSGHDLRKALRVFNKAVQAWARGLHFQVEGGLPGSAGEFKGCIRTAAAMTKGQFEDVPDGPSMEFPFYGDLRLKYLPPQGPSPSTSLSSVPGH
jgi:hypothetical protein